MVILDQLINAGDLSLLEQAIISYVHFVNHGRDRTENILESTCHATNDWLAIKFSNSRSTIIRTIKSLEAKGWLHVYHKQMPDGSFRRFIWANEKRISALGESDILEMLKTLRGGCQNDKGGCQIDTGGYQNDTFIKKYNLKNNLEDLLKESKEKISDPSLFDPLESKNTIEFQTPTPKTPAPRTPFPLEGDFSSDSSTGEREKISKDRESIESLGGKEKNQRVAQKHRETELTTNPSNDTIKSKWNGIALEFNLPQITVLTQARAQKVKVAIKAVGGIDNWCEGIRSQLTQSAFHRGVNDRGWRANFDYYSRQDKALAAFELLSAGRIEPRKETSFDKAVEVLFGGK